MSDLSWMFGASEVETTRVVDARAIRREFKQEAVTKLKKEKAAEILQDLPAPGVSLHIISNGSFDYFNFAPLTIEMLGGRTEAFYGSTWTMNRANVMELFALYDDGKIGTIAMMTGTYFKRRESAVYAALLEGLQDRKQRFITFENHAKIMLFNNGTDYIVMESSANFTANPRLEQTVIVNDKALWEFHRSWMNEMFDDG